MKNLRKVLATITAISAICMSASAFAETTVTGAFDKAAVTGDYSQVVSANTVTATVDTSLATTGTQMTFVIMDADANELNLAAADILYIDQKELNAGSNSFTGVINTARITGATDSTIPDGSYIIKLGYTDGNGDFQIAKAVMVVATTSAGTTVTLLWGDINLDTYVNASDALEALNYVAGVAGNYSNEDIEATVGSSLGDITWGDVNLDTYVNASDALEVLNFVAGTAGNYSDGDFEVTVGSNVDISLSE